MLTNRSQSGGGTVIDYEAQGTVLCAIELMQQQAGVSAKQTPALPAEISFQSSREMASPPNTEEPSPCVPSPCVP